jgi:hypothetical protein
LYLRGRKWQEAGEDCIMRSFITEGKKPLGRPRRKWEDNTGIDLMAIG